MADLDAIYAIDDRTAAFENHGEGILVSIAGPGTGKTHSFLRRIEALTNQQDVEPETICYLTFNREISQAFLADYEDELGPQVDGAHRPRVSTLHSFACRLIRNQGFQIGYDGPLYFMSIADRDQQASAVFLADLLPLVERGRIGTVLELRQALENVKQAWRDNVNPESLGEPASRVLQICLELARAYRLVDWDQAISLGHALFSDLGKRPGWIARIEHFLVDEYQDFNRAEQAFISTLATTVRSIVVVGDDDQSLYSQRGGSPEGLRELFRSEDCDRVTLVRCRRCKSRILETANTLLAKMRPDPHTMLPYEEGGQVACYRFKSAKAEIEFLGGCLRQRIDELPEHPGSKDGVVCLFYSRKALGFYLGRLESQVPCYTRKAPAHPERMWLERVLELVCRPEQRFVQRLILESYRPLGPSHKRAMAELVLENDISPADAMDMLISDGRLTGAAATAARDFCKLCAVLSSQDSGLIAESLSERLATDPAELRDRLELFTQQLGRAGQEDVIRSLCDELIPESALPPEDPSAVLFLTMHGSKGLTKKTVVMPGLEDAWLPGKATGSDLEERRRVFYVAFTRATDEVLITYPLTRARGDPFNYPAPGRAEASRFVTESDIPNRWHP